METSIVNPNKERLFPEIRNKVGPLLILKKVFRSDNKLHRINQLFAANYPGQISEQFFKPFMELVLHFPQILSRLGWLHEHKIYQSSTSKILCQNATNNLFICHRYDSSSLVAVLLLNHVLKLICQHQLLLLTNRYASKLIRLSQQRT